MKVLEPSAASNSRARLNVGLILARRFTMSAFANFVDVLRLAADEGDRSRPILCGWRVLSATMNPVRSSCGISVQPDERLGDPSRFDYIVVVGGLIDEIDRLNPQYVDFLKQAAKRGVPLIGICTGGFILHKAGLMQGYRCCVSWFHHDDFLEQFEGLEPVSDQIYVIDRDRMTCSGGASSAHLAAYLVDRHVGHAAAQKSLHIMIIDHVMSGDDPQPGIPLELKTKDPLVRKALVYMQQNMESAPTVAKVADQMSVGRRSLERRFVETLGMSPREAAMRIRMSHVQFLLMRSDQSISDIAAETGFCDASHLIQVFHRREGVTPREWRNSFMPEL